MEPLTRPLVLWDGDCGFCRRRVERWRRRTGDAVEYAPYQEARHRVPDLTLEECEASVQYVAPDGARLQGARAVFHVLAHGSLAGRALRGLGRAVPGFLPAAEAVYRRVAAHRVGLSRLDRAWFGTEPAQSSFRLASALAVRLVGLAYALAFASLLPQLRGLIGAGGILPVERTLAVWRDYAAAEGLNRFLALPTLSWLSPSDGLLVGACAAGAVLGALAFLGFAPALALFLCTALYLSVVSVGDVFLSFQWDALLCEAGLVAVFLAPWRLRARLADAPEPLLAARWVGWLLVLRLMVFSGAVKLLAGGAWTDLSALAHHYETQPLPTPLAFHAHHLPAALHRASVVALLAVELGAPLLLFLGRRPRLVGAAALLGLQVAIALTGNYGVFNLLTFALCLLLVDDAALARWLPGGRKAAAAEPGPDRGVLKAAPLAAWTLWAVALGGLHSVRLAGRWLDRPGWQAAGQELVVAAGAFRTVNTYGLFAHMTTARFEIELQGSEDGQTWKTYGFRYKPGDPRAGLPWVAPHMPRLDWQMWFAALAGWQRSPWFQSLCQRLLEGAPDVGGLFAEDPFPDVPPAYVRARFLRYRFATPAERAESGATWVTEDVGPYISAQALRPR